MLTNILSLPPNLCYQKYKIVSMIILLLFVLYTLTILVTAAPDDPSSLTVLHPGNPGFDDSVVRTAYFNIHSTFLKKPKHFNNWLINTYHFGAALNWAALYPEASLKGIEYFYINGTKNELLEGHGGKYIPFGDFIGVDGIDEPRRLGPPSHRPESGFLLYLADPYYAGERGVSCTNQRRGGDKGYFLYPRC